MVLCLALLPITAKSLLAGEVVAYGRVVPGESIVTVAVPYYQSAPQVVLTLSVKEGDRVEKGQTLSTTNNRPIALADLARAEATVQVKKQQLQLVEEGMEADEISAQEALTRSLEAEAIEAAKRSERLKQLFERKAAPQQDWDEAIARSGSLDAKFAMAKYQLAAMRYIRPADITSAQAAVAEAEAAVQQAKAMLATTEVAAPFPGQVLKILSYPGERVDEKGLLQLGNIDAMQIKAEIYVSDASGVRPGDKAKIKSEAWQGDLTGTVLRIAPMVERSYLSPPSSLSSVDRRVVEATIALDEPSKAAAWSGAEATVYITTQGP